MKKRKNKENKRAKVKKKNFGPFVTLVGLIRVHVPQCLSSNKLQ